MAQKLRNALFYMGVERSSYEQVRLRIYDANRTMVTVLSAIATFLILAMFISSFKSESIAQNQIVYGIGLALSVVTLILSAKVARKNRVMTTFLIYAAYMIYYMYGILIGAVTDPTGKTVTFMVILVFMPTVFIDRLIHVIWSTAFYVTVFVILCLVYKEGNVLSVDMMDAVIFGILGVACGAVTNHMKVRGYVSERMLDEIGRIDQLTQIRNRNAFELERASIPEKCKNIIACLYVDVNGLHELNNEQGHEAGDAMLQFVADKIKSYFGKEYAYRIGGDEFVAFAVDLEESTLWENHRQLAHKIEKAGYSAAIGIEIAKAHRLSLDDLIRRAEERMKSEKARYYRETDREVRN